MPLGFNYSSGMTIYIYGLYDPRNGLLRYVGKTNNIRIRHSAHTRENGECYKHNWVKSLISVGLRPEIKVLETIVNSDDKDWQERERWWIKSSLDSGAPLTNLHSGGRGGFSMHESTKDKIRAKATGRKMSREAIEKMKASKAAGLTPEVRERIRRAQLGKKQSAETKAKRAVAMTGRIVSEETRRKISEANKISRERYLAANPPKCRLPKVKKERAPISEETREKMRAAKLGRKQTPEAIEAAHAPLRGRKRSAETRAKMSQAKREGWARRKLLA